MSFLGNHQTKKHQPIDYHEKNLENPFYKRREKIISFAGIKGKIIIIFIALICVFILWFIFISHFWGIKKISVTGLDQTSTDDVVSLINQQMRSNDFFLFPEGNLLFFSEKKFENTVQAKYHWQKIDIQKAWPDSLVVSIISKPLACVWNEGDKYYYADTDGYAVQEINPLELKDSQYPLIVNDSSLRMHDDQIMVDHGYIDFAALLYDKFSKSALGLNFDHFVVDDEIDTINLLTTAGLKIVFSTKDDIDRQLVNLAILKDQKLKDAFSKQKLIDLRYGDKIYYQ